MLIKLPSPPWNSSMEVVKVEATDLRGDIGCIVLCHCLYTGDAQGLGKTQFSISAAIHTLRQRH